MSWTSVKEGYPLCQRLFVVKHFLHQKFDCDLGGYVGEFFPSASFVDIDISLREGIWERGGVVTHWMKIPPLPA